MLPDSVKAFGIELRSLRHEDLPLLCHWRNQPEILPFLDVPKETTLINLEFWYAKISKYKNTLAWIAYYDNNPVAYTELKDINYAQKSCAGGLFLFGEKYYGTGLSYRIVLCRELIMRSLALETLYSHVRKNNQKSIDFCIQYGGELIAETEDIYIYKYEEAKREARLKYVAKALKLSAEYENLLGTR